MIPVIICGGVGTKMWPESQPTSPKHFLPLINGKSLFQINYELLRTKFKPEEIYVSTNSVQEELVIKNAPDLPKENIILEPELRNHGPATGLVAAFLLKKGLGDEPFMLVQADVLREPGVKFIEMLDLGDNLIRKEKRLITGGTKPDYAIMGIDYLIEGEKMTSMGDIGVSKVDKFLWRSTKEAAEEYVKDGKALTHANHYGWTPNLLLQLYQKLKPEWYQPLMNYVNGADLTTEYAKMPKGPIEDVTQNVFTEALVVELPFAWIDFGTWESVAKYIKEKNPNLIEIEGQN
ncbi:MAG: sugar phosphate nucleotidyltransferase, partial [Candidatus Shapirobacteria bacterium]|nr:sugar phosphate nucleotidyltransferase [Candidatus Shapirobacteria bacterium]